MSSFKAKLENNKITAIETNQVFPLLLRTITGSRLYGTEYELGENPLDENYVSDYDFRGVFLAPASDFISIESDIGDVAQIVNDDDEEYFELRKFVSMALECNPNIMDILFAPDDAILYQNEIIKPIFENKNAFLSKKAADGFAGYAQSQLSRMQNHRKFLVEYPEIYNVEILLSQGFKNGDIDFQWIADKFSGKLANKITGETASDHVVLDRYLTMDEFKEMYSIVFDIERYAKPHIKNYMTVYDRDFNKSEKSYQDSVIKLLEKKGSYKEVRGGLIRLTDEGRGIFHNAGTLIKKTARPDGRFLAMASVDTANYKADLKRVDDLWSWRCARNEKRAILEEKFGYDTKHAMHLYRLMVGAQSLVRDGVYNPRLSGDELKTVKKIREGALSYDEVLKLAKDASEEVKRIIESGESKLPERPDIKRINNIMLEIYRKSGFYPQQETTLRSKVKRK